VTAWQCEECGEPLERGRCPDRECREPDVLVLRDPPADTRSVLP
jgi:hypothetical protein